MIDVLLVGNPNTGKTTLFNSLTNSDEHTGNWHGVTVSEKGKTYIYKGNQINLVDLPGLYSLTTLSFEEEVARDYLLKNKNSKIINICDLENLRHNLFLTLNLLEMQREVLLALNKTDKKSCHQIDLKKLSFLLGTDVIMVDASKEDESLKINDKIKSIKKTSLPAYVKDLNLDGIKKLIENHFDKKSLEFFAIKCLERDENILKSLPKETLKKLYDILPENSIEMVAKARYDFVDEVLSKCLKKESKTIFKQKIDKVVTNKFLCFPIFFLVFSAIFYLTFFSVGKWLSDGLVFLMENFLKAPISSFLTNLFGETSWVSSLINDAVFGGVISVLSFLPQIALLFMFLGVLEDSGYMSRIAFCFEDFLGKVGLSGKSIYTLLMGFGCCSSAILTARNMDDKNAKIKTAILTPYMSCSAKFPIYSLIGGIFFGAKNIFVIMLLYFLGAFVSLVLSLIINKTVLKSKEQSFILELPSYRLPSLKKMLKTLFVNMKEFVIRVGSVLVAMNVILWTLSNFSFSFRYVQNTGGSMLESLGKILAPIFVPLGFGSWGCVSALIAGVVAKEVVVSCVVMFNHASEQSLLKSLKNPLSPVFFSGSAGAFSFLIFCLLYCPCVSSFAVMKKEIGKKWTIFAVVLQLFVAYLTSFLAFKIYKLAENIGVLKLFFNLFALLIIIFSILFILKKVKRKTTCNKGCGGCFNS